MLKNYSTKDVLAIIGSYPLFFYNYRDTYTDLDFVCSYDTFKKYVNSSPTILAKRVEWVNKHKAIIKPTKARCAIEFEIFYEGLDEPLNNHIEALHEYICTTGNLILEGNEWNCKQVAANVVTLYMLKQSHKYKSNSPHFLKTMNDIMWMERFHNCKEKSITGELLRLQKEREELISYTKQRKYSLNKKKEDFFTDNVNYIYSHDSLHEIVKLGDVPAYTKMLSAAVMCDREKWEAMSRNDKFATVYEEAAVLALERSVIPHNTNPDKAFLKALEKVCTSISSGWWREWAYKHYYSVLGLYYQKGNFYDKWQACDKSLIPLHKKGAKYEMD
jgi:hypothetical protein